MLCRVTVAVAVFVGLVFWVGCGPSKSLPPPTHPVRGKLLDKSGQPVTAGMLEFAATGEIPKVASGELGPDGSFELRTMNAEGEKFLGAEPGEYRVTYYPPMSDAQTEVPINLRKKVRVEATENEFTLKLEQ